MKTGLLASAVVLGMALALPMGASAADTDSSSATSAATSANKSASVTVSGGLLTITKTGTNDVDQMAPSFKFGNANVSTQSQTVSPLSESDGGYTNVAHSSDSYSGPELSVDDNTGSGAGWIVSAALGDFSDGATPSHDLPSAVLHMVGSDITSDDSNAAKAPATDLTAGDDAKPVFSAAAGSGMGNSKASFSGSTLTLPTATYAGTYTASLTYTLAATPTA